jgi:hypothetical protein
MDAMLLVEFIQSFEQIFITIVTFENFDTFMLDHLLEYLKVHPCDA